MLHLVDTTLRDGAQAPGVQFSDEDRVILAEAIAATGVDEMEVGIPATGRDERRLLRRLAGLGLKPQLSVWCRAKRIEVSLAIDCGYQAVHISIPASDGHLRALGRSRTWARRALRTTLDYARERCAFVSVGLMDASRTERSWLHDLAQIAQDGGADRLRLADTVGVWTPGEVSTTIASLCQAAPCVALGVHCHDDLGMASANTVAAHDAGAAWADVTVLGLGERAGNAALEEVALAQALRKQPTRIRLAALGPLARLLSDRTGRAIPPHKAVVGSSCFRHESGLHVALQQADPIACQPCQPETVGATGGGCGIGRQVGTRALQQALADLGIVLQRDHVAALVPRVRAAASRAGRCLDAKELRDLAA
jgi:homocitrate synthase NifV